MSSAQLIPESASGAAPAAPAATPVGHCPACGRPARLEGHGVVAPWVAQIVGLPLGQPTGYRHCAGCDLGFFDYRYDEIQLERLYAGYRGEEYLRLRREWEPSYSLELNDLYLPGSDALAERVAFETELLARAGLAAPLELAIDIGGDHGQFFPPLSMARRVVVEFSQAELIPGVERVASLEELEGRPDLVVLAHVLEHVSEPRALLAEIHRRIDPDGFFYVEVPLGRPRLRRWHRGGFYRAWLSLVSRRRAAFLARDRASLRARLRGRGTPRLGIVKCSEHLNFFTADSLRSLLETCGFELRAESAEPLDGSSAARFGRLAMVAVPRG